MQPWVATLIGAGIVVTINLLTAAFIYGKLTESVQGMAKGLNDERNDRKDEIRRIDREQNEQWTEINASGRSIEKLKGKLGVNGA